MLALAMASAAFVVYVLTLAPGLVADTDTPKLQFIGRVLGTPHHPGYPLYVFISHVWSYVPLGTLAYRINLLSAVFGALTAALLYAVGRRLGCGPWASATAAGAAATGRVFWAQSIVAEVYTLNAALVVGLWLALLHWTSSGADFVTNEASFRRSALESA